MEKIELNAEFLFELKSKNGQVYGPWLCMAYTRSWWQCFSLQLT